MNKPKITLGCANPESLCKPEQAKYAGEEFTKALTEHLHEAKRRALADQKEAERGPRELAPQAER